MNLKTPFELCLLGLGFYAKPVFFFYIFSGDPHVDALIIGRYLVCIIIGQTLGEGAM